MAKKIVAVNAGPRKGWNTDTLVSEAAKGAEAAGAEVVYFDTDWPWTMFDPAAKQERHDTVFPQECKKAFEMGKKLAE